MFFLDFGSNPMALIPLINILLLHKPSLFFSDRHFQRDDCVTHAKTKRLFTRCSRPRCCHCKKWKYLLEGEAVIVCLLVSLSYLLCTKLSVPIFCLSPYYICLSVFGLISWFLFISPTGSRLVRACPLNNSMLAFSFCVSPSASLKVSHLSKNCLLSTKHSLPDHLNDGCKNTAVFTCLSSLNSLWVCHVQNCLSLNFA